MVVATHDIVCFVFTQHCCFLFVRLVAGPVNCRDVVACTEDGLRVGFFLTSNLASLEVLTSYTITSGSEWFGLCRISIYVIKCLL